MFLAELEKLNGDLVIVAHDSGIAVEHIQNFLLTVLEKSLFLSCREPENIVLSGRGIVVETALHEAAVTEMSLNIVEGEDS